MTDKKRKIDLLSKKEKDFLLNYLALGKHATKAYMKTYPTAQYNTASVNSHKMLNKPAVKEALKEYLDNIWEQREEQISKLFDDLLSVAGADISDFIDENGDIKVDEFSELNTFVIDQYSKSVSESEKGYNKKVSIKLMDKLKAIQELTKMLGMIQEKVEHSGTIEIIPAVKPPDYED